MKTAITEMFGIRHPIIQGGMHYVGLAQLASAVSNAGGLGIITGLTQKAPELLAREIVRCRDATDKPFGVTIGSFQVLQHRAADMLIALEQARSMAMLATMMAADEDVRERRQAISAAKVQIGRSGRFIGQQAIQIHGGIGMTMETKVAHSFKRVTTIDTLFGDADHHLGIVAEGGGLIAA